jgi:hypothetical protein
MDYRARLIPRWSWDRILLKSDVLLLIITNLLDGYRRLLGYSNWGRDDETDKALSTHGRDYAILGGNLKGKSLD